jgi:hypothetical protein
MKNVSMTVKGKVLTIVVDLSKSFGASKSGKTEIVATTEGNAAVPGHDTMRVGLNVFATTK